MNTQSKTVAELARHVGGEIVGDPNLTISSVAPLSSAGPGQISFLSNPRYQRYLETTRADAVLVKSVSATRAAQIVVPNPYYAFAQVTALIHGHRRHPFTGIDPTARIAASAQAGTDCRIGSHVTICDGAKIGARSVLYPNCFIGPDTRLGDDCVLYANTVVYENCLLGHRVVIHANTTIGQDGLGFATQDDVHHKIPHVARVIIEDDVEIGSGAAIERGTLADTVIGRGTKIGGLVAVGHGVRLGPGCTVVAQTGIAGSTVLGHHCTLAGQVGVAGHLEIGNRVTVAAKSGVHTDLADGDFVFGIPAIPMVQAAPAYALLKRLPDLRRQLLECEARLRTLEANVRNPP